MKHYELYMAIHHITARKDGAIFHTQLIGNEWVDEDIVTANDSTETNIIYIAASDDFANSNMTIRVTN
jgi:hypothetical protein